MKRSDARLGMVVRTKHRMQWHALEIPARTEGKIVWIADDVAAASVKFDDGLQYGTFDFWLRELEEVPSHTAC